ncbi:MAG TPA: G1 family glutamic endopeptidase [Chloroflexota bacterium]|nr:G1 family glutamic endopeptidase [Chloroflexota bacterium]
MVVVVLVLVGVTVPSGAPGHQLWTSVAGGTLTQAQADSQVTIQAVIQQANTEQSQALATGNPTLMSPTANAAYYRQLVQINQGLAAQGATAITLSQITWGAISVTGTTATATTTETWITTFSDGTTTESTDVNNYTLVDQGGAWLIESDQQPAATPALPAAGTQPAATPQPSAPAPLPAASVGQNTSHNWSGYAVASGTYTGVSGTWTVPQPRVTGAVGVGATWVGIGGVTTHDLIQAGTQDTSDGSGQAQFQTWIETLPQPSQQVPLAVVPGDSVTVSIDEAGASSGVWQISIKNNTSGQSYQTTVSYMSSESSAEWVEEAPSGGRGVLPLDQFNTVSFSAASATLNGQTVDLAQAHAQPITMLNANNQPLAVPSSIGGDGASFSVARTSAPATTSAAGGPGRQPGAPAPVPAPVPGRVPAPAP